MSSTRRNSKISRSITFCIIGMSKKSALPEVKTLVLLSPPHDGILKFNVNEAARGKLGPAGIVVSFVMIKGKYYLCFQSM